MCISRFEPLANDRLVVVSSVGSIESVASVWMATVNALLGWAVVAPFGWLTATIVALVLTVIDPLTMAPGPIAKVLLLYAVIELSRVASVLIASVPALRAVGPV